MYSESALSRSIESLVNRNQGITAGSALGLHVQRNFPLVDMRRQYGGLKRFIFAHCPSVKFVAKKGGDDLFAPAHLSAPPQFRQRSSPGKPFKPHLVNWKVFSNPFSKGHLFFKRSAGKLGITSEPLEASDDIVPIEKITSDEQKAWIEEFADSADSESDKAILKSALGYETYWPVFWDLLQTRENGRYQPRWLMFRESRILATFRSRLETAEMSEDEQEQAVESLTPEVHDKTAEGANAGVQSVGSSVRELATKMVEIMSEEEILQLKIPLEVVQRLTTPAE